MRKKGQIPEWPNGADCKSAGLRLRWFESIFAHKKNCGSSSVDRALAFQAEGRGFEPRLPLFWKSDSYRKISIWFLFLENAESARNYAVEVNQEVNQKFYECSNQRSVLQVENFSKWRIPLNGKSSQKRQTDYAEFRHISQS